MLRTIVRNTKCFDLLARSVVVKPRSFSTKKRDNGNESRSDRRGVFDSIKNAFRNNEPIDGEDPFPILVKEDIPDEADVVIIGGGAMGSSVAYWLKTKMPEELRVVVIEQDPTYAKASTTLSVGGLRQQFSLEENIKMSLFGADFLRNVDEHLGIDGEEPVDVSFRPHGYLLLASEQSADVLSKNSVLQNSMGAKNILLTPSKLKDMFPWISTEGVALGCLGLEKEGWFDPWALLCAFKRKAMYLKAKYIHGTVVGFDYDYLQGNSTQSLLDMKPKMCRVIYDTPKGERRTIDFAKAVIAAGPASGKIADMVNVCMTDEDHMIDLPVEPRKRYVYCFHCPTGPGLNTPLTIDTSGTYFRREGLAGNYICGRSPEPHEEPSAADLEVNHEFFEERVWPELAKRVKAFEHLKVNSSWAGYYEYNTFDANGIIGGHPVHENLYFATGFSGHGIQQSPAVGQAIADLILDSDFSTIDLSRLGFDRLVSKEPMSEVNIV